MRTCQETDSLLQTDAKLLRGQGGARRRRSARGRGSSLLSHSQLLVVAESKQSNTEAGAVSEQPIPNIMTIATLGGCEYNFSGNIDR